MGDPLVLKVRFAVNQSLLLQGGNRPRHNCFVKQSHLGNTGLSNARIAADGDKKNKLASAQSIGLQLSGKINPAGPVAVAPIFVPIKIHNGHPLKNLILLYRNNCSRKKSRRQAAEGGSQAVRTERK